MRHFVVLRIDMSGYLIDTRSVWRDRSHIFRCSIYRLNRSEVISFLYMESALVVICREKEFNTDFLSLEVSDIEDDLRIECPAY